MKPRYKSVNMTPARHQKTRAILGGLVLLSAHPALAGGGGGVVLDIDLSFVIQLGILLALWVMLKGLVFGPYLKSIEARAAKTSDTREAAEALQERAQTLEDRYQAGMADARVRAAAERQALRVDGLGDKDASVARARTETHEQLTDERVVIAEQISRARAQLMDRVGDISTLVVTKILGRGA